MTTMTQEETGCVEGVVVGPASRAADPEIVIEALLAFGRTCRKRAAGRVRTEGRDDYFDWWESTGDRAHQMALELSEVRNETAVP